MQREVGVVLWAFCLSVAIPSVHAESFVSGPLMSTIRSQHTATLLTDGRVLVAGGVSNSAALNTAEIYDPSTSSWSGAASMTTARYNFSATLLTNGKVLVAGGFNGNNYVGSAELYDPVANAWSSAGSLVNARIDHTATLLPGGKVLVAGGQSSSSLLGSAEIYDPVANSWSAAASLAAPRQFHTATLLPNGKVLVAAGYNGNSIASSELYDPVANVWSAGGTLISARRTHTATLLPNGKVLAAGGIGLTGFLNQAELYDPTLNTWSPTASFSAARGSHTATLLPSGKVLLVAGIDTDIFNDYQSSAEAYDPTAGSWSVTANLPVACGNHTATLLVNGIVLVAGGANPNSLNNVSLYLTATRAWNATGALAAARSQHSATLLPTGKVLVAGGSNGSVVLGSSEIFDPGTNVWISAASLTAARSVHTATLLRSGKVLVVGGFGGGVLSSAELYDPLANVWSSAGNLATARAGHTATLLPNGRVLVAGGQDSGGNYLNSVEQYDPAANSWSAAAPLATAREFHTALMLSSGKAIVAGGFNGGYLQSAELYDFTTNTWSAAAGMLTARASYTLTSLPNGNVLAAGGYNFTYLNRAELYDPVLNTWTLTASLATARAYHTATLTLNGDVLVAGGSNGTPLGSTELYGALNAWSSTGAMTSARQYQSATLLPDARLLVAGGTSNGANALSLAEILDDGLHYQSAWRPSISPGFSPIVLNSPLHLSGTGFQGISGASGGSTNDASSNYPIVQLRSLSNEQTLALPTNAAFPWSGTSFTSQSLPLTFPQGYGMITTFSNGIPSVAALVQVSAPSIIVSPIMLPEAQVGAAYNQMISAAGGSGSPYSFSVTLGALPAGLTLSSAGALSGTPTAGGSFNFTVSALDLDGDVGSTAYVLVANPPAITFNPMLLPAAQVGVNYNQAIAATGGTAPYSAYFVSMGSLPAGVSMSAAGEISGTPTAGGTFFFTVSAKDSSTGTGPYAGIQAYSMTVMPPAIAILPPMLPDSRVGVAYHQALNASGGTSAYAFTIKTGLLPAGLNLTLNGILQGTPSAGGSFDFVVTATDSSGGTGPYSFDKEYTLAADPPTIALTPGALSAGTVGMFYSEQIFGAGGTAPYTAFTISQGSLPNGISLDLTGTIIGIPSAGGTFNFSISVMDSSTGKGPYPGTAAYALVIGPPTIAFLPATLPDGQIGMAFSQMISGSGGTAPYNSFAISDGALPMGLMLDTNGLIHGAPLAGGTFNFTVAATDSSTGTGPFTGAQEYTLVIPEPVITLMPPTLPDAQVAVAYMQALSAGGGLAPYTFSLVDNSLPGGLSLSTDGVLSGTPTDGGTFEITLTATDSSLGSGPFSGSMNYTLVIEPPAIVVNPSTLPDTEVNEMYLQSIVASGGTPSYTYTVSNGTLPNGLVLSPDGVLSGIPKTGGAYTFAITATDASGGEGPYSTGMDYQIYVNPGPFFVSQPTAVPDPLDGLMYTFTAYVNSLKPAAVTWDFGDGAPTAAGETVVHAFAAISTYTVTVTASDGLNSVSQTLTVRINSAGLNNPIVFEVDSGSLSFDFQNNRDSLKLAGSIPINRNFTPSGKVFMVSMGGFTHAFVLDAKGEAGDTNSGIRLFGGFENGSFYTTSAAFKIWFTNQNLFDALKGLGFKDANVMPAQKIPVAVTVSYDGLISVDIPAFLYTAKAMRSGKGKLTRK